MGGVCQSTIFIPGGTSPPGNTSDPASLPGNTSNSDSPPGNVSDPANLPGNAPGRLACRPKPFRRRQVRPERYTSHNAHPAFPLHYDWTGWPAKESKLPPQAAAVARATAPLWERDGLRLLSSHAAAEEVQLLFNVTPQVSPVFFCMRVKGRLQHALRKAGVPTEFSRKVAFRSLGENTDDVVGNYIRGQIGKGDFADPRFRERMRQFTVVCDDAVLAEPSESNSGRYWYNLHLVLVVADRFRITNPGRLGQLRDAAFRIAAEGGHRIGALSMMPDHVHMALRGNIERSPAEIAPEFQNGLARAAGCRVWQAGYYVGTFSAYDLDVIRRVAQES